MISVALSCSPDAHGRGESGPISVFTVGGSESSRSRTQFAAACTPAPAGTLRQRTNTSPNNSEPSCVGCQLCAQSGASSLAPGSARRTRPEANRFLISSTGDNLATLPIAITHQSKGGFGSNAWLEHYENYIGKWATRQAGVELTKAALRWHKAA
jgi:hypothetical protein